MWNACEGFTLLYFFLRSFRPQHLTTLGTDYFIPSKHTLEDIVFSSLTVAVHIKKTVMGFMGRHTIPISCSLLVSFGAASKTR